MRGAGRGGLPVPAGRGSAGFGSGLAGEAEEAARRSEERRAWQAQAAVRVLRIGSSREGEAWWRRLWGVSGRLRERGRGARVEVQGLVTLRLLSCAPHSLSLRLHQCERERERGHGPWSPRSSPNTS
eukprot:712749-Rhodomonas_salina.1